MAKYDDKFAGSAPLFDDGPDAQFQRLPDDLSEAARQVLAEAMQKGFTVRRSNTEPVVIVGDGTNAWRLRSNREVEAFGGARVNRSTSNSAQPPVSKPPASGLRTGILIGVFAVLTLIIGIALYQYDKARRWWNVSIPSAEETNALFVPKAWTTPHPNGPRVEDQIQKPPMVCEYSLEADYESTLAACIPSVWVGDKSNRRIAGSAIWQAAQNQAVKAIDRMETAVLLPDIYVDIGVCPGCEYGLWRAKKRTLLYSDTTGSVTLGDIANGEIVIATTGQFHSVPVLGRATSANDEFKVGDEAYLLTYFGEGYYRIWFKGKVYSTQADMFSCEGWERCADALDEKGVRWVQIYRQSGQVGWVKEIFENFSGPSRDAVDFDWMNE